MYKRLARTESEWLRRLEVVKNLIEELQDERVYVVKKLIEIYGPCPHCDNPHYPHCNVKEEGINV